MVPIVIVKRNKLVYAIHQQAYVIQIVVIEDGKIFQAYLSETGRIVFKTKKNYEDELKFIMISFHNKAYDDSEWDCGCSRNCYCRGSAPCDKTKFVCPNVLCAPG